MTRAGRSSGFFARQVRPLPWSLMIVFLFLIAAIMVSGFIYYQKLRQAALHEQSAQLQAVADLKAGEISNWRAERLKDADMITQNRIITAELLAFLEDRRAGPRQESIQGWMMSMQNSYDYRIIMLLDKSGQVALAATGPYPAIGSEGMELLEAARGKRSAVLSDLHSNLSVPHIHMDAVAPLLAAGQVAGFVLMRIDPDKFLFRMIQTWPTPSPSAETLLVRRDGDSALYLNELRHRQDTALKLRMPLTAKETPAVMAVLGQTGAMSGHDYRGIAIWSVTRAIADTPWFMVTKIDLDEIERPIRRNTLAVLLTTLSLLLAAAMFVLILWVRQRSRFRLRQLEAESEKQALVRHFDFLSRFANDLIILSDSGHNIIEANERAVQAYGYSREELLGMNIRALRVPSELESLDDHYRKAREHDGIIFETVHQRRDGSVFPLEVSARVIQSEGKEYFQSIYRDISERKRAEDALRRSEKDLRESQRIALVGSWRLNLADNQVVWTEELYTMYGFDPSLPPPPYTEHMKLFTPESWERLSTALARTRETGIPYTLELETVKKDGNNGWIWVRGEVEVDSAGKTIGLWGVAQDITERKQSEDALRESEAKFRALVENLQVGIVVHAPDTSIRLSNPKASAILGLSPDQMLGKKAIDPAWCFIREDRTKLPLAEYPVNRALAEEMPLSGLVLGVIRPDHPSPIWVECNTRKFLGSAGGLTQIIVTFSDITERKQAEETIRQSEERLRAILDATPFPVAIVDVQDNQIDFWSRSALDIFGHTAPTSAAWYALAYPDPAYRREVVERWKPFLEEAQRSGKAVNTGEYRITCRDGSVRICELHAAFLAESLIVTFNDITARKQAESQREIVHEALKREQFLNNVIINSIPGAFYVLDENGRYKRWNAYQRDEIIGKPEDQVAGSSAADTIHQDDRELIKARIANVLGRGREEAVEGRVLLRGGPAYRWLLMTGRQIMIEGRPFLVGIGIDISERKQAESQREAALESLRESERKFRETVVTLDEGYYSVTLDGKLLEHNRAFNRILGFDISKDLKGTHMPDFWQNSEDRKEYVRVLAATGSISNYQINAKTQQGENITVLASSHLIKDETGRPQCIEGVFLDISERMRAEAKIKQLNEELEQRVVQRTAQLQTANKELEAFSYSVSHDLRAPLRAIDGFSRIVLEEYSKKLDKEGQRLLNVITANTGKMGHLIDDLLAFSRLGRQQMSFAAIDLSGMAAAVFSELQSMEKGRKIEFKAAAAPVGHGDHSLLRQVLQNLLANAIKFTRTRKAVRIEFGGRVEMTENVYFVKDNGVGFDMEYVGKLFGVFQRLHGIDEFEGTGVGLAIVQRIVQRHGGRVWAEGEAGKGAVFYFSLPKDEGLGSRG